MWKMQLLDREHLLIKYASEEVVTLRSGEPNSQVWALAQLCFLIVENN